MHELSPAQRRELKAKAHHLHPVVAISTNGLSATVLKEIDASLQAHELIKIRVYGADRGVRTGLMEEVCAQLEAAPVQMIGNLLVIWRKRQEREETVVPAPKAAETPTTGATLKSAKAFAMAARRRALAAAAAEKRSKSRSKTGRPPARGRTVHRGS